MLAQEEVLARISDAPWATETRHITIGGAGGLGSWLALFLARIGHTINIYDFDHVGTENIGGGQFYGERQAGNPKTEALRSNINQFVGSTQFNGFGKYEKGMPVTGVVFTTFDNMEARKDMFDTWKSQAKQFKEEGINPIFINISMLPEGGFIEVVDRPSRVKKWDADWVPSADIEDLACTFKSTTHNAAIMAGYGVAMLNNHLFNRKIGEELRYIPYRTTIDLNLIMQESHE